MLQNDDGENASFKSSRSCVCFAAFCCDLISVKAANFCICVLK